MKSIEPTEETQPTSSAFPGMLRGLRESAGMSQNGLAERAGRDPGTINRLESGKRAPVNRDLVEDLARALDLGPEARDALLAAAGHLPDVYRQVGLGDPDLRLLADLLGDERLGPLERRDLRLAVRLAARRWREVSLDDLLDVYATLESPTSPTPENGVAEEAGEDDEDEEVAF
jgi:transcriptional regulator with XRE-family HTH domain